MEIKIYEKNYRDVTYVNMYNRNKKEKPKKKKKESKLNMVEREIFWWNWETIYVTEHDPDAHFPQWHETPNRFSAGNWIYASYRPYYHFDMRVWPNGGNVNGRLIARNTTVWEWVVINADGG